MTITTIVMIGYVSVCKPFLHTCRRSINFLQVCKIRVSAQAVCAKKPCTFDGNLTGNLAVTQEFPSSVQADLHTPNRHNNSMVKFSPKEPDLINNNVYHSVAAAEHTIGKRVVPRWCLFDLDGNIALPLPTLLMHDISAGWARILIHQSVLPRIALFKSLTMSKITAVNIVF